jgi:endonuclease YncB( thermonuclease family)
MPLDAANRSPAENATRLRLEPDRAASSIHQVRELIRAEVARAHPVAESRRALELIVETSLRYEDTPEGLKIAAVDHEGRRRTVRRDGREVDLTIGDLIAELRQQHPRLFAAAPDERPRNEAAFRPATRPAADQDLRAASDRSGTERAADIAPAPSPSPRAQEPAGAHRDVLSLASPASAPTFDSLHSPAGRRTGILHWGRERLRAGAGSASLTASFGPLVRRGVAGLGSIRLPVDPRSLSSRGPAGLPLRTSRFGARTALILLALAVAIPLVGVLGLSLVGDASGPPPPDSRAAAAERPPAEPRAVATPAGAPSGQPPEARANPRGALPTEAETTGTIQGQDPMPAGAGAGSLRGVAEVLDTATLSVQGKVIRLFGVEWAKGAGDPDDLAAYLRGREVLCRPEGATDKHRCEVQGQDLSKVVLFNGGGRATPEATPDLKAAEEHARSQQVGVWGADSLRARP